MLYLYNTLNRKIEPFKTSEDKEVKMYTCGPSTYQLAHIGNYRTFLFEDILQRYLEHLGYNVKRIMPLTDVEDKAIAQAKKEKLTLEELTNKNEAAFFKDFELLKIKKPLYIIRASTAVDQAVNLILKLVEKGIAYFYVYKGEKNVYFDPLKIKDFGKLAHLNLDKWPKNKRRFHKDTYPGTPWNLGDFVLWHGCKQSDVCYQMNIGSGRPAWNIQDTAIVTKHLGFTIDVGCGGIDNLVRHHDYTLAIAEAISGKQFSRFWLHSGHLFVDGKKMSKSTGNVYYPNDLLDRGFSSEHLRFFLIYKHYRQKLNFTFEKLAQTSRMLDSFKKMVTELQDKKSTFKTESKEKKADKIISDFERNMNNDLDAKFSFDILYKTISELHENRHSLSSKEIRNVLKSLRRIDNVLQCLF